MNRVKPKFTFLILIAILSLVSNCSFLGMSDTDEGFADNVAMGALLGYRYQKATISGKAMKRELRYALVQVHPLTSSGTCNRNLTIGTTNTDGEGNYDVTFLRTGGSVCVSVGADPRGISQMLDEKSGSVLSLAGSSTFNLTNIINESSIRGMAKSNTVVSPFSSMLTKRVLGKTQEIGVSMTPGDMDKVVRAAGKEVVIRFGLNRGFGGKSVRNLGRAFNDADFPDLNDIVIDFKTPENPVTQNFNLLQASFSTLGDSNKTGGSVTANDIGAVVDAFSEDMVDGKPDGKGSGGSSVSIHNTTLAGNPISCGGDPTDPSIQNSCVMGGAFKFASEGGSLPGGVKIDTESIKTQAVSMMAAETATIESSTLSTLSIAGSPPVLQYGTPTFTQYTPVSLVPSVTGSSIISCSVAPALPAGLTLGTDCTISGTPTSVTASATYTITGKNLAGSGSVSLTFEVKAPTPPSALTYSGSPLTLVQGNSVSVTPTYTGVIAQCSASPALPAGMSLSTDCKLLGIPTVTQSAISYTITASNAGGSTTASVSIAINTQAPTSVVYPANPLVLFQNSATTQTPVLSGGVVSSCSSDITLPAGLSLGSQCQITGTPTGTQAATNYTITATNVTGSASTVLSIEVKMAIPTISYVATTLVKNVASTISPTKTGTIESCSASPALGGYGLSINPTTCVISGTPTNTLAATVITVTAINSSGTGNATFSLTITDLPAQCTSYSNLDGNARSTTLGTGSNCDNGLAANWYRFTGSYVRLASLNTGGIPAVSLCGTDATGYFNGNHPTTQGTNVSGTACFNWSGNTCAMSTSVQITNCGSYYVYYLTPTSGCSYSYCTVP